MLNESIIDIGALIQSCCILMQWMGQFNIDAFYICFIEINIQLQY